MVWDTISSAAGEAWDNASSAIEEGAQAFGMDVDLNNDGVVGTSNSNATDEAGGGFFGILANLDEAVAKAFSAADKVADKAGGPSGSKSSGGGGVGAMEFDGKSVDDMREMMNDDPQKLMDHLDSLSDEDRQMAMQMMNQRMQQINQMFSMMSNMAKSQHDTAKAAINNMRV